jgi:hypothetical protein
MKQRLEEIREEIRNERVSIGELIELRSLVEFIDKDDVELLEWAGVPEFKNKVMNFREETIKEFNYYCDTTLREDMSFQEAIDDIEKANNNYFYVSMNKKDVKEAIENEKEIADQLDLDKVLIKELGIYIALYP